MKPSSYPRLLSLVCLLGVLSFVSGCSADLNMPDTQGTSDFGTVRGGVFGGQQPITGAHVYVFETPNTGTPGYGNTQPKSLIGDAGSSQLCSGTAQTLPIVKSGGLCYYQTGGYNGTVGLTNPLVTTPGEFNLTGYYKCDVGQNVWLYSVSGYPLGSNADLNKYATLMADLGQCPASGDFRADTYIYMNELSTVAMAYAIAGFAGDTTTLATSGINTMISGPTSNPAGINNAFNNAQQLYNIFGLTDQPDLSAPQTTTAGVRNGVPPYYLINTLGDVLASCINSPNNRNALSSSCNDLFVAVYGSGATANDTASAMIHIAKNPNNANPGTLLNLARTNPVWLPNAQSSGAPTFNDLSAAIQYSVTGSPQGIAVDAAGNAYVNAYDTNGYVVQLSPLGAISSTSSLNPSINDAASIAVDSAKPGRIWSPGAATGNLYEISTNSSGFTGITTPAGDGTFSDQPHPIAADGLGYVLISDATTNGGEIYKTNGSGSSTITAASFTAGYGSATGCVTGATGVAVDNTNTYAWVTGTGSPYNVCRINTITGGALSGHAPSSGTKSISNADAVAVDANQNAWVLDESNENLHKVTTGSVVSGPYSSGGMAGSPSSGPMGVLVDGAANVWTINDSALGGTGTFGSLSEISSTGAGISDSNYGFQYGNITTPKGFAIDISGNIWVANYGVGTVLEVIGIASPTNALYKALPGAKP